MEFDAFAERPGGTFELPAHQAHSERYGAEGATYWVARRTLGPS